LPLPINKAPFAPCRTALKGFSVALDDIKKLIDVGKEKGYLTYNEVNDLIPHDVHSPEDLDDLLTTVSTQGIDVEGFFILTMAGEKILSTKSEPFALAKFHSLRTELENKFPTRELTTEEKAELPRKEVTDSTLRVGEQKKPAASARISTATLFEVQAALRSYCASVETSDLSESSQAIYINGADNFVRWLKGDFDPDSRLAPYKVRKKK
jgi:Sigma-70 factor, region 1.1